MKQPQTITFKDNDPTHFTIALEEVFDGCEGYGEMSFPIEHLAVVMSYYIPDQQIRTLNETGVRMCVAYGHKKNVPTEVNKVLDERRDELEVQRNIGITNLNEAGLELEFPCVGDKLVLTRNAA